MWWLLFPRWIWFFVGQSFVLLLHGRSQAVALPKVAYSHAGMCPNEMNPNLWVDAMSTCTRECESDQDCEPFEKCCSNVCGSRSCVAARYLDAQGKKGPLGMPAGATCDRFMCPQQGSECDVWDGQLVCKCRDRCEREPRFTCASDGMTYYNRCYMDAEACSHGVSLTEVACRFHLAWPDASPPPAETTPPPPTTVPQTTPPDAIPPSLTAEPTHQSVLEGETASLLCEVTGRPVPQLTWQKQAGAEKENEIMRPNYVQGNVVVTNVGQLVIYNAQPQDAGVYTCTAYNLGGSLQAHFPLSVVRRGSVEKEELHTNGSHFSVDECRKPPDTDDCGGESSSWYYDAKKADCFAFSYGGCGGNGNRFESYEACARVCSSGSATSCNQPWLQGPCKAYEPRWAFRAEKRRCEPFVYGGCGGNGNNFANKEACEAACLSQKARGCRQCKPRQKMATSFCKSDFVVLGRMAEPTADQDSGHVLVTVEEILKDEKMGLRFLGREPLEVTLLDVDRGCPCPSVSAASGQLIIMGDVHQGMAVLQPHSFVGPSNARRLKKLREVIQKNSCDVLKEFPGAQ
ncbi:WAP, Kazal, immunoglobulin, Kunitz and NTR domain-containing protein 2-like [Brienomyrus brachyistius]|uniref:WAP, Kazal, immunoglobulin, Kunitz and NTR domain-containing protein 2-like n=1 Tax=Brienomyrus brachyistius TaxID=42636 RepID=UPI0020B190A5|nr:WAP, Kazal, immunoglobulin, Kunitz and NTR domain-containing protein 2-like [Brienomyrus brachyistius]